MSRVVLILLLIGLLAVTASATVTFSWVEDTGGGVPAGYDTYDLQATSSLGELAVVEMYIDSYAPAAGDFYQNAGDPTYDTQLYDFGAATTGIIGEAIDIVAGNRTYTFNDQLLDVAWGATSGTPLSGGGALTIARVTVKEGLMYGSWELYATEVSAPSAGYTASDTLPGWPLYDALGGDANLSRSVTLADFGILQTNFNTMTGMDWGDGDFNDSDSVTLADFGILQTNFGDTYPPEPPESPASAPEPTTCILLLSLAGLAVSRRKGRKI